VRRFQSDPACRVFLGQVKAAGTAICLDAADDVAMVEASTVPGDNYQAYSRVQNVASPQPITVSWLSVPNSADERLQAAGYENYEISNWARPGHQSRHNLTYWQNLPYLGMGAGAHSNFAGRRFSNVLDPQQYINLLKLQQRPEAESEIIDRVQEMSETAFLALRTAQGLHLPTFEERFAEPFASFAGNRLRTVEEAGLLEQEDGWLRLSKRGRLLGNEVFFRLLPD